MSQSSERTEMSPAREQEEDALETNIRDDGTDLDNDSGVWPGGEDCDFCTEERLRAVKSCLNCTASYCETHERQHSTVPARQSHTLVEATGNLEHRLCPQHHRALELFCNTDQMPICSLCPALTHRGHDVVCSEHGTQRLDEWIIQHHPLAAVPPTPGEIAFPTVGSDSVSLSWGSPEGMDTQSLRFRVTCISGTKQRSFKVTGANHTNIQSLRPGEEYTFSVAVIGDNGMESQGASSTVRTVIPTPVGLTVDSVTTTSFSLRWREPHGLDQTPSFLVSNCSPGTEPQLISTELHSTVLSNLQPGRQYTVSVCTVLENCERSEAVSKTLYTDPSPPENLSVEEVRSRSVRLCWDTPTNMEGVSYTFSITYTCYGGETRELTAESNRNTADLCDLKPGMEYSFSICTVLHNGTRSRVCSTHAFTKPSPPGNLNISFVRDKSVSLSWDRPPDMQGVPHAFKVTLGDSAGQRKSITIEKNFIVLSNLRPVTEYSITIRTVAQSCGLESEPVHTTVCTKIPAPVGLTVDSVTTTSFSLHWSKPDGLDQTTSYLVSNCSPGTELQLISTELPSAVLSNLQPGRQYTVSVCAVLENGEQSEAVSKTLYTELSAPESLRVEEVRSRSLRLCWDTPTDIEGVSYTFSITYTCDGEKPRELTTESNSNTADLCDLKPGMEYSFSICTVFYNGTRSRVCSTHAFTKPSAPGKLNIASVCETSVCLSWDRPTDMEELPHTVRVTWEDLRGQRESITTDEIFSFLLNLTPGTEYNISVCTVLQSTGLESEPVHTTICTKPSAPGRLWVEEVKTRSVRLCWNTPILMEAAFYTFSITYTCDGQEPIELTTESNSSTADLCDLKPGVKYSFSICTVLHNGIRSRVCSARAHTRSVALGISFMRDAFARPPRRSFMLGH